MPPHELSALALVSVLKSEVCAPSEATTLGGSILDYVLASRAIAPMLPIQVQWHQWDVPWKPHAAILVKLKKAVSSLAVPQLTKFPCAPTLKSPASWPVEYQPVQAMFLGQVLDTHDLAFAQWCFDAERSFCHVAGNITVGRGWQITLQDRPLVGPFTCHENSE